MLKSRLEWQAAFAYSSSTTRQRNFFVKAGQETTSVSSRLLEDKPDRSPLSSVSVLHESKSKQLRVYACARIQEFTKLAQTLDQVSTGTKITYDSMTSVKLKEKKTKLQAYYVFQPAKYFDYSARTI
jgi:hypothetical protein